VAYLEARFHFGPLPRGVTSLYWVLYGRAHPGAGYRAGRHGNLDKWGGETWGSLMLDVEEFQRLAFSRRLFSPPAAWPPNWPEEWPAHVRPIHLLRAFSPSRIWAQMGDPWTWFVGVGAPELVAYWSGVPLTREEAELARRGARMLMESPQFNVWAYNVPTDLLRRHDVSLFAAAQSQDQTLQAPLSAHNKDVQMVLPPSLWTRKALAACAREFDPLRTIATDMVLRVGQEIKPWTPDKWVSRPDLHNYTPPRPFLTTGFDPAVDLPHDVRYGVGQEDKWTRQWAVAWDRSPVWTRAELRRRAARKTA
jgi:hypothetical protein